MKELLNELENLMDDFNRKISEIVGNSQMVEQFKEKYEEIARDYIRKMQYVLEDYGLDNHGKSIQYLRDIIISQGEINSEKEASQHTDAIVKALRMLNIRECDENKSIIESGNLPTEEKKENINRNARNKTGMLDQFEQQLLERNKESAIRVENYCKEAYESLENILLKRISDMNAREFQDRYDSMKSKIAESKVVIRRLTEKFVEDYQINLNEFDKSILMNVMKENQVYVSNVNKSFEQFEHELTNADKEKNELQENPFELSDEYKKKVVEVGKEPEKPKENDDTDEKKIESLEEDVII